MNRFYRIAISFIDEDIPDAVSYFHAADIREADDRASRLLSIFSVDCVSKITVALHTSDSLPKSEQEEP